MAVTQRLWAEWIVPPEGDRDTGQSEAGRLWDVVWMLRCAIVRASAVSSIQYEVLFQRLGRQRLATLKAVCGPGDNAEPVITVMLPDED